jgi:hypothetical protein
VFGVMYVLNIKEKKKMECVKKLRRMMMEIWSENENEKKKNIIRYMI